MKLKKLLLIAFATFLIICNVVINAFAMNTGFSTNEMSREDQDVFLSNINLSLISEELPKASIECFDVSDRGLIAIGFAVGENKYISVYNDIGEFQYGYRFCCNQSFGVQWDDTNIIIYFVRSDTAASFDLNGVNVELRKIEDTVDNDSYWNSSVFLNEKIKNNNKYIMKSNMGLLNIFASSYSQLVKSDSDGNETIIYDASTNQTIKTIIVVVAAALFVILVIAVVIRKSRRTR